MLVAWMEFKPDEERIRLAVYISEAMDKELKTITQIHKKNRRTKDTRTLSATLRMLLWLGIKQYKASPKYIRELNKLKADDEEQQIEDSSSTTADAQQHNGNNYMSSI